MYDICVCSFNSLSQQTKDEIQQFNKDCNITFLKLDNSQEYSDAYTDHPISAKHDIKNVKSYSLLSTEDKLFLYNLYKIGCKKIAYEKVNNMFFDFVFFINNDQALKAPDKISEMQVKSTLKKALPYDEFVNPDSFVCDTITFNIVHNFYKMLAKTDERFFMIYEKSINIFFNMCLISFNIGRGDLYG